VIYLLYTLEVIVCVFLILVILLQQGSGADLSVFGGGGSQTALGGRGATQMIHKLTVWGFVAFIFLTLGIAVLKRGPSGASVMSGVDQEAVEGTAPAAGESATEVSPEASPTTEVVAEELKPADATPGTEDADLTEGTPGIEDAAAPDEAAVPPQP
jgi:preprotein translocase subunit SecG